MPGRAFVVIFLMGAGSCTNRDAMNDRPPAQSAAAPARPVLRRLLTAHPETVARQAPPDNDARIAAYLKEHPEVPAEIAAAIKAHQLWAGMSQAEAVLSVGPATRQEAIPDRPGAQALFYAGEGWLLRFDAGGYLYELVER
jgi:hypothetical protein